MRGKTYTSYTHIDIKNVASIKTVSNQCYYNPYYHRTQHTHTFFSTLFIHHLCVFLLFHQRLQRARAEKSTCQRSMLYTHRYVAKLRGVSYSLAAHNTCLCLCQLHNHSTKNQAHWIVVCCERRWCTKNMRTRSSKLEFFFQNSRSSSHCLAFSRPKQFNIHFLIIPLEKLQKTVQLLSMKKKNENLKRKRKSLRVEFQQIWKRYCGAEKCIESQVLCINCLTMC